MIEYRGKKSISRGKRGCITATIWISFVCLFSYPGFLYAQETGDERGLVAAKFLEFSPSVRASGMGNAFVAVSDLSGITWNPAGLAFLKSKEIGFTHGALYQKNKQNFITGVLPLKEKYGIGVNILSFETEREPVYDWSGNTVSGDIFYKGTAFGLAGAVKLSKNLSIGMNAKSVEENIAGNKVGAFSSDIGGIMKIPALRGVLQLALAFCNVGPRIRDEGEDWGNMPQTSRVGAAYLRNNLTVAFEYSEVDWDRIKSLSLGAEYWIEDTFAPRFGLKGLKDGESVSLGFGLKWRSFKLDYAFLPHEALGGSHRAAIGLRIGAMERRAPEVRKPARVVKQKKHGKTMNIAVAELAGKNVSAMDAAIVADFLRTELVKTRVFKVLDRQNMERILAEQKFQMSGCTTDECAVQIGKILNVEGMIVGTFSKFLGTYYINVSFIDVETGEIVAAEAVECSSGKELPNAAREIAERFAGEFQ